MSAAEFDFLVKFLDFFLIGFPDFVGRKFDFPSAFHVDEDMGAVGEFKLFFHAFVFDMKQNDFMFIVAQVLQGGKQFFRIAVGEHVGKDNDQSPFVDAVGQLVEHLCRSGRFVQRDGIFPQQILQQGVFHLGMGGRKPGIRQCFDFIRK